MATLNVVSFRLTCYYVKQSMHHVSQGKTYEIATDTDMVHGDDIAGKIMQFRAEVAPPAGLGTGKGQAKVAWTLHRVK